MNLSKEEFIQKLTSMTKEELHEFILTNGKEPKLITLVERIESYDK